MKTAAESLIHPIHFIINQSLKSNSFLHKWKIAQLIPLHKGKGLSKFNPSNYRPISILPVISKLAERSVQIQMMNYLENTKQINRNHHTYRKFHSTISAMIQISDRIFSATDANHISTLLTIDKSSAFDCVSHKLLLDKMSLYKFNKNTIDWFKSYLSGRTQYVVINSKESSMSAVSSEVPQGSMLGPILYTLFKNELPHVLKDPENCTDPSHEPHVKLFGTNCIKCGEITCFADDASAIYSSNSRVENQLKMKTQLKTISEFITSNKLSVNEDKTTINEIMMPQKRTKITGNSPTLTVKDKNGADKLLQVGKFTRILGANISNNLTWSHHLETGDEAILPKIRKQIGALNLLSKTIPRSSRLLLANGLIMSRVCYLSQVWGMAPKTLLKKVQIVMLDL